MSADIAELLLVVQQKNCEINRLVEVNTKLRNQQKRSCQTMTYLDEVYDIVRLDTEGMDAIYKDYIIQMVGVYGFNALHKAKLIEDCGVVNGRQLYVLCEKN